MDGTVFEQLDFLYKKIQELEKINEELIRENKIISQINFQIFII